MKPATILIALANVLVYLAAPAVDVYGFVPAHASVQTAFTSMFVHDPTSLAHILGNMSFLLIFGTLVERDLGSLRFLLIYVAAGFGGALLHTVVNPSSTDVMVGASGAIFGVLAAAAMLRTWAVAFVAIYMGFNVVALFAPELVGMKDVAVGCHVGGFVVGFLMVRVAFSGKLQEATA